MWSKTLEAGLSRMLLRYSGYSVSRMLRRSEMLPVALALRDFPNVRRVGMLWRHGSAARGEKSSGEHNPMSGSGLKMAGRRRRRIESAKRLGKPEGASVQMRQIWTSCCCLVCGETL